MRASRLLSLMMTLQARGRVSASRLAEELGVSVRTVYRDVDELSQSGVPVVAERGAGGGFELLDGWRTRLTGFTSDEARSLFLLGLPGPARELGLGEAMASAQLKLLAALPAGWQDDVDRVGHRFHLDSTGWYRSAQQPQQLTALAEAVWGERRLALHYQSWKGTSWRTVEPLGLVLKGGDWYLVAAAPGARGPVGLRVSSVREVKATGERFKRPRRFDLAGFWAGYVQRFEASLQRQQARVRFSPKALAELLAGNSPLGRAVREARPAQHGTSWTEVTFSFESIRFTGPDLLRLAGEAEVLEPAELRAYVIEAAEGLARVYLRRGEEQPDGRKRRSARKAGAPLRAAPAGSS